jgi:hypothetical protein
MNGNFTDMPKTREKAEHLAEMLLSANSDAQPINDIRLLANALDEIRTKVNTHFADEPAKETPITTLADLRKLLHINNVLIDQYKSR